MNTNGLIGQEIQDDVIALLKDGWELVSGGDFVESYHFFKKSDNGNKFIWNIPSVDLVYKMEASGLIKRHIIPGTMGFCFTLICQKDEVI